MGPKNRGALFSHDTGPVAQAVTGLIFEIFQEATCSGVQAGNLRACRLQAKCRMMPD